MNTNTQNPPAALPQTAGRLSHVLRWSLPFLAALLPIVLLTFFSFPIPSSPLHDAVEATNLSEVSNVSQLVTDDLTHMVALAHAIASVPGTITAAETQDDLTMNIRLKAIKLAYPQLERVFVTDEKGVLWGDFPSA